MADFTGLKFNGKHTSELNLYVVSNSSRYSEDLTPSFQDKTVEIPGNDGEVYFGTTLKQKRIPVYFAFDNVSELQFREIKQWLNVKEPKELIFDERPYVVYDVKVNGTPQIKYLCFMRDGKRVYKGDFNVTFVSYRPFGHNPEGKYSLADYDDADYPNKAEWEDASGLPATASSPYLVNNAGQIPTPFIATLSGESTFTVGPNEIEISGDNNGITWNSKTGLVYQNNQVINGRVVGNTIAYVQPGNITGNFGTLTFQYLYY